MRPKLLQKFQEIKTNILKKQSGDKNGPRDPQGARLGQVKLEKTTLNNDHLGP